MKEKNLKPKKKNQGMTLVESLVAMTLLTLVMLSVFEAFNYKIKADKRSGMRTHALTYAENRLEELFKFSAAVDTVRLNNLVLPEDFITTVEGKEFTNHGSTQPTDYGYVFHRTYTVGVDPLDSRLRRYVVTVKYGSNKVADLPFKVVLTSSKGVLE